MTNVVHPRMIEMEICCHSLGLCDLGRTLLFYAAHYGRCILNFMLLIMSSVAVKIYELLCMRWWDLWVI